MARRFAIVEGESRFLDIPFEFDYLASYDESGIEAYRYPWFDWLNRPQQLIRYP